MSTKRKRPAPATDPISGDKPIELVVRRGALWRFNTLKKKTADLPVTVLWDRRQSDRRAASSDTPQERRASDRRQKPPFTWEIADFVVVGQPAKQETPDEAKPAKKKKP
jgi:hypothetical protein